MSIDDYIKKLMLPLIYVYSLSLGLIFLSAFLIVNKGESSVSYAQSVNYSDEYEISINLSSKPNTLVENLNENESITTENICDNDIVKKIDGYLNEKRYADLKTRVLYKSPLSGNGCNFYLQAIENNLDPMLVISIAIYETGAGVNSKKVDGIETHNAWGWGVMDNPNNTNSADAYWCDSWEHCIGRVSRGIKRNSDQRNLSTNPSDIVKWYNPGSVERAGGIAENSTWSLGVQNIMNQIDKFDLSK